MTARRCRGERGASLVIALGFLALCGVLIPAIVSLAGTNLAGTSRLHGAWDASEPGRESWAESLARQLEADRRRRAKG